MSRRLPAAERHLLLMHVVAASLGIARGFEEPILNVTAPLGREVGMKCVIENLGEYKVAWVHVDRQMILSIEKKIITRIPRFSVIFDAPKTWILHITNIQKVDEGGYMCQINTKPMLHQMGYLTVVVPPNILDAESSKSHVIVKENSNITLVCRSEGSPQPRITWRKEDNQFIYSNGRKVLSVEGDILRLSRVSRADMGAYLCIASNGVPPSMSKRILLNVEFFPTVWTQNQLVGAPSGTDALLECDTESYPRSINYWVREENMIMNNGKYEARESRSGYKTSMKLLIRNLSREDFGSYSCIAKNSLGEVNGLIRLYEVQVPSMHSGYQEWKDDEDLVASQSKVYDLGFETSENLVNSHAANPQTSNPIPSIKLAAITFPLIHALTP